jgi:hypothetical protein
MVRCHTVKSSETKSRDLVRFRGVLTLHVRYYITDSALPMAVSLAIPKQIQVSFDLPKVISLMGTTRQINRDVDGADLHPVSVSLLLHRLSASFTMSETAPTRFTSVSSDGIIQVPSSPSPASAPTRAKSRRSAGLPRAFRDMIATEPLFGAHLEGRLTQLERRMHGREGKKFTPTNRAR